MSKTANHFYVYAICDPRLIFDDMGIKFKPFYIGKGSGNRSLYHVKCVRHSNCRDKNERKQNYIKDIISVGIEPVVFHVQENLTNYQASLLEIELIKKYGRIDYDENGILTNIATDIKSSMGGGKKGMVQKKKRDNTLNAKVRTGQKRSSATKKIMAELKIGKKHTDETRSKMSKTRSGKNNPQSCLWEIITPSGEIFIAENGLRRWCKENNHTFCAVYNSNKGYKTTKIKKNVRNVK